MLIYPGLLILTAGQKPGAGDEPAPSRLGRLFRFGSSSNSASSSTAKNATPSEPPPALPPAGAFPASPAPPVASDASVPLAAGSSASPRIIARPRVSRALTESDPILTRITLNRSDDGNVFGMFFQVYADGTIVDSEGVHHVGTDVLKPLIEALQAGDLYRLKGHCGAPATDYLESVQIIVYERSLGRLRANAFSYSGNPQGCDNAVRHLHGTLENLQAKVMRTVPLNANAVGAPVPAPLAPPVPPVNPGPDPAPGQGVIPLTTPN
jgi:hypothetical protein